MCAAVSCIKCEYCAMVFEKMEEYVTHLESYKHFICSYCEKDFFTANELYFHFLNKHAGKDFGMKYICGKCGKYYTQSKFK